MTLRWRLIHFMLCAWISICSFSFSCPPNELFTLLLILCLHHMETHIGRSRTVCAFASIIILKLDLIAFKRNIPSFHFSVALNIPCCYTTVHWYLCILLSGGHLTLAPYFRDWRIWAVCSWEPYSMPHIYPFCIPGLNCV